jgi:glycosyltransferase involved in cell wall biosynthesis
LNIVKPLSVSIYFFTGDFKSAILNFRGGKVQTYATHHEIGQLSEDFRVLGIRMKIYSFVTPSTTRHRLDDRLEIINLGANGYAHPELLKKAVLEDESDYLIPHFPNIELLKAASASGKRTSAFMATTYNTKGPRSLLNRYRTINILRNGNFEIISNHCEPSSRQLVSFGINAKRIVPWDIPHRFEPANFVEKSLSQNAVYRFAYAGTITESKGVSDIIDALALLKSEGVILHGSFAGGGDIELMKRRADQKGIGDQIEFLGTVDNNLVFDLYRNADVAIVPSRFDFPEGFPLTMFEAIASRTPIVCSDHPVFQTIMVDNEGAAVFESGDPSKLKDALLRVLHDSVLYNKLSAASLATWSQLANTADWRTLIRKVVTNGPHDPWITAKSIAAIG